MPFLSRRYRNSLLTEELSCTSPTQKYPERIDGAAGETRHIFHQISRTNDSTRVSYSARRHGDDSKLLHVLAHSYLSITFYLLLRRHCCVSIRPYLLLRSYCCALLRIPGRLREYSAVRSVSPPEERFSDADEDFLGIYRCREAPMDKRHVNNREI